MQTTDLLTDELSFSDNIRQYLAQTAKWGRFLGIMGFIIVGLMAVLAFIIPQMLSTTELDTMGPAYNAGYKTGMTVTYLVFAVLMFFPCLYLLRFGKKMNIALQTHEQESFENSFENLKSLFKFYGIVTIIVLCFYAIALVLILAGLALQGV